MTPDAPKETNNNPLVPQGDEQRTTPLTPSKETNNEQPLWYPKETNNEQPLWSHKGARTTLPPYDQILRGLPPPRKKKVDERLGFDDQARLFRS